MRNTSNSEPDGMETEGVALVDSEVPNPVVDTRALSEDQGWKRLAAGVEFALSVHAKQKRKGTDMPYASHLFGVASLVLEHGGNEEQAIAAMLHDAVEDQGADLESVTSA